MTDAGPNLEDLRRANQALGLGLDDEVLAELAPLVRVFAAGGPLLDGVGSEPAAPVASAARYPRPAGGRPSPEENPWGAWAWKVTVEGAPDGPLAGATVALKDNVGLAGVPMTNGSALLDGYIPDFDATVVTRILDAGGRIVGKAACEDMCLSAGSHTSVTGVVRNPHDPTRSAGGSSSGSGALLAAGACDLAIGGDQGGSIRIPSALCGVYGLKPTHGLVPYTGAFPLDPTIDHLGPMGRDVTGVATLLEVLAGPDGLDPRQAGITTRPYRDGLYSGVRGLRVGAVTEGFGSLGGDERVDTTVRSALDVLGRLGAEVSSVSVPFHSAGTGMLGPLLSVGVAGWVLNGDAGGLGWRGWYPESLIEWFARTRRQRSSPVAPNVAVIALAGQCALQAYGTSLYAQAQNLIPTARAAYDAALAGADLLVMPTVPTVAPPLPPENPTTMESIGSAFANTTNTAQFDLTGHPAMSVPCGRVDGLPVGMMLIGRRGEDDVVLRAAYAFEQTGTYSGSA